ncbi:MAG TPA: hypothetical protein VGM64_15885 [Lacunisphaera sp.]|jgi:hypothetical protein
MKNRFVLSLFIAALAFSSGCETVNDRIKEKPEAFSNVDQATQDKIKQGIIDIGFTEDMVYLALGKPDQTRESANATGKTVTWVYNTYYQRPEGTHFAGYNRQVYFDPYLKTYRVYYRPVYADIYSEQKEERIRIVFKDGKASVIEQSKD